MKAQVQWLDNVSFVGTSGSGHSVVMDGSKEAGGHDIGIRPMEMLLLGMGGCASFDVITILQKSRQNVIDCKVKITAQRANHIPKVFTKIHLHFIVKGKNLAESRVKYAISLSAEKYCSASIMLNKTATISHDYKIITI